MSQEIWRAVPNWPAYEVSSIGGVRSVDRLIHSPLGSSGSRFYRGRMIFPRIQRRRKDSTQLYHWVTLYNGPKRQPVGVHALVLMAFVGPRPQGMVVRHKDGDGLNNALVNLHWGTQRENEADKRTHGTCLQGERHHQAKLTKQEVELIRSSALTSPHLAEQFNVHESTVRRVRRGNTWRSA